MFVRANITTDDGKLRFSRHYLVVGEKILTRKPPGSTLVFNPTLKLRKRLFK